MDDQHEEVNPPQVAPAHERLAKEAESRLAKEGSLIGFFRDFLAGFRAIGAASNQGSPGSPTVSVSNASEGGTDLDLEIQTPQHQPLPRKITIRVTQDNGEMP